MSDKRQTDCDVYQPTEADELRLSVAELNQSIAYLSKMVLHLQRSINEKKPQTKEVNNTGGAASETLH